jgi:predicted DNA-binding protein YlxM (UPF0122 family)
MSEIIIPEEKAPDQKKKAKRRSLGRTNTHAPAMELAADAIKRMEQVDNFISLDRRDIGYVSPNDIRKTFNARFIPCTLENFQSIDWPELDLDVDTAKDSYPALLSDKDWYKTLDEIQQKDFILFLEEIHTTAQSIVSIHQVQSITLEREHEDATEYFVIDGERRTLACLYSKGKIPVVKAQIYNYILSDLQRALVKDAANTDVPLKTHEKIVSKKAIYDAIENVDALSVRALGKVLGYNKDQAGTLRKVLKHEESDRFMARISKDKLSWRKINFLLDNGIDAKIISSTEVEKGALGKHRNLSDSKTGNAKDQNIQSLQEGYSHQVGYPCVIKTNKGSNKVKVQFSCSLDNLDEMMTNMQRIKVPEQ